MNTLVILKDASLALIASALLSTALAQSPESEYLRYWQAIDSTFADPATSPLMTAALAGFDSVPRFAYNPKFRVQAEWQGIEAEKPQKVLTSTSSKRLMQKVGVFRFVLDGVELFLPAYSDLTMARLNPKNTSYFLPFTDLSNGETTYMGGRYLDLDVADVKSKTVVLDFNLAYNPYCAYSDRYSCPIPPVQNNLKISIEAGARIE